jgi:hypothetical protein|tara:strand:- start:916 stop:1272 length:357 start_codon:yes stop_codon:yes gene_type:complete
MNEIIKEFCKMAKDETKPLNLEGLMSEDERTSWETLVKTMDSIDILNVGRDLEKVSKTYILDRQQQLFILAYVKLLEMMIARAKDAGVDKVLNDMKPNTASSPSGNPISDSYSGSMFG